MIKYIKDRIIKESNSGCWLWIYCNDKDGYGLANKNGKIIKAHRLSYEIFKGSFNKKQWVLHKCDTPSCVNPDHLFLGSAKDNSIDSYKKGRANIVKNRHLYVKQGIDHKDAKLDDNKVKFIRERHIPYVIKSEFSTGNLAKRFGVSTKTIEAVLKRKVWKHVK